jgi:glycosyltransferase involved in cell wall biosynthesis
MKVFVNAYNLRIGGGESVGVGVIESLYHLNEDDDFHVLICSSGNYKAFKSVDHVTVHHIPHFYTNYLVGRFLTVFYLLYLVHKLKPDVIFSMGNYAIPSLKKQLVLLHWPYIVYPDSVVWKQMSLVTRLKRKMRAVMVRRKLKFASAITVQTSLMKERVLKHLKFKSDIHIVESSTALHLSIGESKNKQAINRIKQSRKQYPAYRFLLFVSVYYSHKNIAVLIPLAKQLKENKEPFKLFISLNPNQNKATAKLLTQIKQAGLEDVIINLGNIPHKDLIETYQYSDAFIMPTLLESYGITYMEAMMTGIPIFTSDLDFAHETCGDAAFYFDPLNYQSIYNCLLEAYKHPDLIVHKTNLGKERAQKSLSWAEITERYLLILKNL